MAQLLETLEDWQAEKSVIDCNKFMLENEISTDVTFLLGQKKERVKAHRYVLISRSSVFQSIFCSFDSAVDGDSSDCIPISDIEPSIFKLLLMYLYTGDVSISSNSLSKILYAANKYAVRGLVKKCLSRLESILSGENVCVILEQVHMYEGKELEQKCISFIYENAEKALKSLGFENLCSACIERIIESDELVVEENEVYKAVLKWSHKECERRGMQPTDINQREVMGPLLFKVRFPLVNPNFFTKYISQREILNPQEIIAVYQYFHGQEWATNWKFTANRRRGFSVHSVIRFSLVQIEEFEHGSKPQAVCFNCSESVLLYGLMMYGGTEVSASYEVRIHLLEESTNKQLSFSCVKLVTDRSVHTYDLFFTKPVLLKSQEQYRVALEFEGPPTKIGIQGKQRVTINGVTFQFTSVPENNTTVDRGQIPGLLFTLTEQTQASKHVSSQM